jgi:polysaccharide biosynthesis protein PslF
MVVSTFGLINRGKGLEYAIEAMRDVVKRHPEVLYLILGETHPVVRRREGESYREELQELVRS